MAVSDGKIADRVSADVVSKPYPHVRATVDSQESKLEAWQAAYLAGLLIGCVQQIRKLEMEEIEKLDRGEG